MCVLQRLGDGLAGGDRPCVFDRMVALPIVVARVPISGVRRDRDLHVGIGHRIGAMTDGHTRRWRRGKGADGRDDATDD